MKRTKFGLIVALFGILTFGLWQAVSAATKMPVICDNINGGNGFRTLCFGRTFSHISGGVITYAANYKNSIGLSVNGAGTQFILRKGQSLSFLSPDQKNMLTVKMEGINKTSGTVKLKITSQKGPTSMPTTNTMAISLTELNNLQPKMFNFENSTSTTVTKSSANGVLVINLNKGAKAVGFYMGNGFKNNGQVTATITLHGKNNKWLGTFMRNPGNPVTTFFAAQSNEPIYKVTIDYGNSILSEMIDNFMFVPATIIL